MGAPLLLSSMRRKSNQAAVAPPPPPPLASRPPAAWSRPSSKNVLSEVVEGTVDATIANGGRVGGVGVYVGERTLPKILADHLPAMSFQKSKSENNNNSDKPKKFICLNIAPDTESESMQVNIIPESSPSSNNKSIQKDDCCTYTVGSVEYSVKHGDNDDGRKKYSQEVNTEVVGGEGKKMNCLVKHPGDQPARKTTKTKDSDLVEADPSIKTNAILKDSKEVAAEGGGDSGKKKKSARFSFRKSVKKQGNSGGDKDQGSSNNSNNNGDQNGDKKDDKDNSEDDGNDEKKDSGDNNGDRGPRDVFFGPERVRFASDSTLPLHAGSESTAPADHPSWTPVDGTEFKVRAGPNYSKTGRKEASSESLYEVCCVRYFRSEKRTVGGAARIMPLPEILDRDVVKERTDDDGKNEKAAEENDVGEGQGDTGGSSSRDGGVGKRHPELKDTHIPDVLVVHFMLPYETPTIFKPKDDGPGGECVYYLRPSRRFLDEISGRATPTAATLLFARWCAESRGDLKMRSRFKCMALVRDIDKHNFGLLKSYNGKPVLITESGRVGSGYHGDVRYLEMTANVHYWAFMAKKGFVSLIPKFANMQMEVGFNIEAHTDGEMPECMLGSTVLNYINESTGPMITPEMQEPVHEHQS